MMPQGLPGASSSALRGPRLGRSAGHQRRSARSYGALAVRAPAGLGSPGSSLVAAQRGVVEEGAVLRVVVGHESAPNMARRARPAHRVRSCSPSWVPRRARDDSGRRTSEALTGGFAQPSLPRMSLPGGRPYPVGRGGPRRASAGAILYCPTSCPYRSVCGTDAACSSNTVRDSISRSSVCGAQAPRPPLPPEPRTSKA